MSGLVDQPATRSASLDADERQELQRLREKVATLRAEPAPAPGRKHVRWASIGAAVLVVLGCLLVPVSLVAVWTNSQVSDTDRFVATVSPLISDPSVQKSGFELAARIPEVHPTVDLFPASTLVQARSAYNLLDAVTTWLPWATLILLVGGVLLASNRRRALLWVGVGIMVMMVAVAIALLVLRALLIGSVPQPAAAPAAATFDIVAHFLRLALRSLFVVGLVGACTGFLTGSSVTAVQIRGAARRSIAWLRRGRIAEVLQNGPGGPWVHTHRRMLQGGVVILAVLFVIFLDQPTGLAILSVVVALLVLFAMIELLNRPALSVASSMAAGTVPPNAMS